MNNKEVQKHIIDDYIDAYNNFDVENMLKGLDENVVFRNISGGEINLTTKGIAEFKRQAEQATKIFSQREQRTGEMKFDENTVEVEIFYSGVIAVDLSDKMKSGDKIELSGKSVFRFEDEKIVEIEDIS